MHQNEYMVCLSVCAPICPSLESPPQNCQNLSKYIYIYIHLLNLLKCIKMHQMFTEYMVCLSVCAPICPSLESPTQNLPKSIKICQNASKCVLKAVASIQGISVCLSISGIFTYAPSDGLFNFYFLHTS